MKITLFGQAPYRFLPADFEQHHSSVVTTPYSLVTPEGMYTSIRHFLDELMVGARAGFDGIAVTEHGQSTFDISPNPDLAASALAYATEVEGLPVAIYPMGRSLGKSREPLRVAEEYALLDVMSNGRLMAGFPVGLGYDAAINNSVPPMQTRRRFGENLDLVLRAWGDREPFAWNGTFSQYPMVNIWPRPLHAQPPVWITGTGNPETMRMTLTRGFGFNFFGIMGASLIGQRILNRYWEIADEVGVERNPHRLGFMQGVLVADTDEQAERMYGQYVERGFRQGAGSIPPDKRSIAGMVDIQGLQAVLRDPGDFGLYYQMSTVTFGQLVEAGSVVVGSPSTVRDRLLAFCRENHVGNLQVWLGFGGMPKELVTKNILLFASEVAPALRALWSDSDHPNHWWPQALGGDDPSGAITSPARSTDRKVAAR